MVRGSAGRALLAAWLTVQPGSVDFPRLALDALPVQVRATILRAQDEARARPRDAEVVERLAMLLHAYQQFEAADRCYAIARRLAPQSFAPAYLSALVQADRGDLARAADSLRGALAIQPSYLPARVKLAELLLTAGAIDASRAVYESLAREFPELAIAQYGLGRIADVRGEPAVAASHYRRALSVAPDFGAAHYALALAYRAAGAPERAQPHLQAYARLGASRPSPPDPILARVTALRSTARDLIAEGARLEREGRLDEAIARQREALTADPAAAQAHVNLIALYGRTGALAQAEAHYRAALALDGGVAEAHYNYGVLMVSAHREAEAAEAFAKALAVDPFYAPAHYNLGALLARQGRLAEAAAHYREALVNEPRHRAARFNLGRLLVALGQPHEAIEQLQRTIEPEDAQSAASLYALAAAHLAEGDRASARRAAERALRVATRFEQTALVARIEAMLREIGSN